MACTNLVSACLASAVGLLGLYLTQASPPAAGAIVLAMGAVAALGGNLVPPMWASVFTMAFVWSTLLTCAGFALGPLPASALPAFPRSLLKTLALAQGVVLLWRCFIGPWLLGTPSHAQRWSLELDDATAALERALEACAGMVERWAVDEEAGKEAAVDAATLQQTFAAAAAKVEALARRAPMLVVDRALVLRGREGHRASRLARAAGGLLQATQFLGLVLAQLGRAEGRVQEAEDNDVGGGGAGVAGGGAVDLSTSSPPSPPAAGARAAAAARAVRASAPQLQRVIADARLNLRAARASALGRADAASSAAPWYRTRGGRQEAANNAAPPPQPADVESGLGGAAITTPVSPIPEEAASNSNGATRTKRPPSATTLTVFSPVPAPAVVESVDDLEAGVIAALRAEGFGRTSDPPDVLITSLLLAANSAASFLASAALAFAQRGCDDGSGSGDASAHHSHRKHNRGWRHNARLALRSAWLALVRGGGGGVFSPTSAAMSLRPRRSAAASAARAGRRASSRAAAGKGAAGRQQHSVAAAAATRTTTTTTTAPRPARTGGSASLAALDQLRGSGGGGAAAAEHLTRLEEEEARRRAAAAAAEGQATDDAFSSSDDGDDDSNDSDDGEPDPFAAATTGHRSGLSMRSRRFPSLGLHQPTSRSRSPSPTGGKQQRAASSTAAPDDPSASAAAERAAAAARLRGHRRQAALAAAASGRMGHYVVGGPDRRRGLARAAAMVGHESTKAVLRAVVAFVVVALITNTLQLPQLTFVNAFLGASFVFSGAYLGKATFVFWLRVTMIVPGILLAWATFAATGGDANRWLCWLMAVALAFPFVSLARVPLLGAAFGFASIFVLMPLMLYQLTAAGQIAALVKKKGLAMEDARKLIPSFIRFGAKTFAMTAIGALIGLLASYTVSPVLAADKARDAVSAAGYRLAFALLRLRVVATSGVSRRLARLAREQEEGEEDEKRDTSSKQGAEAIKKDDSGLWSSHPLGPPEDIAALDAAARGVQALCEGVHVALAPMPLLSFFAALEPGFRGPWRPDLYARVGASLRSCATLTAAWVHGAAVENRRRWSRAELLASVAVNERGGQIVGAPLGGGGGAAGASSSSSSGAASAALHGASPYSAAVLRLSAALAALESGRPLTLFGLPPPLLTPEEGDQGAAAAAATTATTAKGAPKTPKPKPAALAMRAQARAQRSLMSERGARALSAIVRLNDDLLADVVAASATGAAVGAGAGAAGAPSSRRQQQAPPPSSTDDQPQLLRHDWLATSHGRHALVSAVLQLHLRALVDEALSATEELLGAADARLLLGAEALAGLAPLEGGGGDGSGFAGSSLAVHTQEAPKKVKVA
jgi:hypothetical protein